MSVDDFNQISHNRKRLWCWCQNHSVTMHSVLLAAFQEYIVTQFENIRQCFKDVEKSQVLLNNKLDSVLRSTGSSSFNTELPEDVVFPLTRPLHVEELEEKLQDDQSLQDCLVLDKFSLFAFVLQ